MNEQEFEAAYRALIEQDAKVKAPHRLRNDVMARWDVEQRTRRAGARSAVASARGLVAAAVVLIVAGVVGRYGHPRLEVAPSGTAPARALDSSPFATRAASNPIVRLVADPRFETESLQIVRLRLPGASLEPFGIEVQESDQSRLVEVDLLVGDDGLPREIRSIKGVVLDVH